MTLRRVSPWKAPLSATSAEPLFAGVSDWEVYRALYALVVRFELNANVAAKRWFFYLRYRPSAVVAVC